MFFGKFVGLAFYVALDIWASCCAEAGVVFGCSWTVLFTCSTSCRSFQRSVAVTQEVLSFPIVANTIFDSAVFFNIQLNRGLETSFTLCSFFFFPFIVLNTLAYFPLDCS